MNKNEIRAGLSQLGIKTGDIILLHSSLASLGKVEGGAEAVIEAFLECIGETGTLAVPVFGALGVITEIMRHRPDAIISSAPVGTLAAVGAQAEKLCADHWKQDTAHGHGTPYEKLAQMGGKICLLGVDQDRNTFLHGIEAQLELPYLATTTRTWTDQAGVERTHTYKYYPGPHRDFIGLDGFFERAKVMKKMRIGNAEVRLLDAAGVLRCGLELGKEDPAFALCDNPNCPACVRQRADLVRSELAKESFKLAASSRLAGRYVPEMVEKLKAAGISYVELDFVQGEPCCNLSAERLTAITSELQQSGIEVSGLRCFAAPVNMEKTAAKLLQGGINRVILPLCSSDAAAKAAVSAGLQVDFFNSNHSTQGAVEAYSRRVRAIGECGVAFNPVGFTCAGENPFTSYRQGRFIKIIRQLDVNDALKDGTPTHLARGNSEIKELVSILRCMNFSGYMVLGGGGLTAGNCPEMMADFQRLLANC